MLANMFSMQAQHGQIPGAPGPAGLSHGMPSTAPSSVASVIERLEQQLMLSSAGSAVPPAHGVFDSLGGLASASAAAAGGLAGLLPAGKHTLQVGPGNNPMYKASSA